MCTPMSVSDRSEMSSVNRLLEQTVDGGAIDFLAHGVDLVKITYHCDDGVDYVATVEDGMRVIVEVVDTDNRQRFIQRHEYGIALKTEAVQDGTYASADYHRSLHELAADYLLKQMVDDDYTTVEPPKSKRMTKAALVKALEGVKDDAEIMVMIPADNGLAETDESADYAIDDIVVCEGRCHALLVIGEFVSG